VLVGLDLVQIAQVRDSIQRFGSRYLHRVYTERELAQVSNAAGPGETRSSDDSSPAMQTVTRLASTFAAKEATLKVLRPEVRWMNWRSIEVLRMEDGWPEVVLHGAAAALAKKRRVGTLSVSMTHEAEYAGAVVVATGGGGRVRRRRRHG
jgi:holo-[acyl-carrier protein] synthase